MYAAMANRSKRMQDRALAQFLSSVPRSRRNAVHAHTKQAAPAVGERVFLAVPQKDLSRARALGAEWDQQQRLCWIPASADKARFAAWIVNDAALHAAGISKDDVLADFAEAMKSYGLVVPDKIIADGTWQCAKVTTRSGQSRSHGGYVINLDGVPRGHIRNFMGASGPWRYQGGTLTREQRAALEAQNRERQAAREEQLRLEQEKVAERSLEILTKLPKAEGQAHPYLERKGVGAYGVRVASASHDNMPQLLNQDSFKRTNSTYLIVPGRSIDDRLLTAQAIGPDGFKMFVRDARKKGAFHLIGVRRTRDLAKAAAVLFVEGYATGASLHEATGLPVVIAFDAGNLVEVVRQLAPLLPAQQPKIVCADNDQYFLDSALAKIAEIGGSPNAKPMTVQVLAGAGGVTREVTIDAAHADGQWHLTQRGKYRLSLETVCGVVRGLTLDVVIADKPHVRQTTRNTGVEAAEDAARMPGGCAVTPVFASLEGRPTDFNDLGCREGRARAAELLQPLLSFDLPTAVTAA
jgi:putative DNA primase/helicase